MRGECVLEQIGEAIGSHRTHARKGGAGNGVRQIACNLVEPAASSRGASTAIVA